MTQSWLNSLAEQSLGNFEATPLLDRDLSRLAIRANIDPASSQELYTLLAAKIARFAERFRYWRLDPWHFDDVTQETYHVFTQTVQRWNARASGPDPRGYLFYFFSVFPLWLSDAVQRLIGRNQPSAHPLPEEYALEPDPVDYETDAVSKIYVDDICNQLDDDEASLLRLRVSNEQSVTEAARQIGLSRRTAYRRWGNVLLLGRDFCEDARAAS